MRCRFYIEITATKRIYSILETVLRLMLLKVTWPSFNLVTNLIPFGFVTLEKFVRERSYELTDTIVKNVASWISVLWNSFMKHLYIVRSAGLSKILCNFHNYLMVLLILLDTFFRYSSNVNLSSNVNPWYFCDDTWETLLLLKH